MYRKAFETKEMTVWEYTPKNVYFKFKDKTRRPVQWSTKGMGLWQDNDIEIINNELIENKEKLNAWMVLKQLQK